MQVTNHFQLAIRPTRLLAVAICLPLAIFLGGCFNGPNNAPVQADKAREVLRTALDSWKKGEKVDSLQSANPPIYVIDLEWQTGYKMKEYQIMNGGEEKDAQLFCPVKLTLRDPKGAEVNRQVIYIISTAPNITVSRKLF